MEWLPGTARARFDDLTAGRTLSFTAARELVAWRAEQVAPLLRSVDEAVAQGWWAFGYLAYEAAAGLDEGYAFLVSAAAAVGGHSLPGQGMPLAWFALCEAPADEPFAPRAAGEVAVGPWRAEWSREEHARRVEEVRSRIAAGESYQCNLTTRLHSRIDGDPEALYERLAARQQAAHNAFLDLGRWQVASASPELFLEWEGGRVRSRPMKGTAARGADAASDERAREALRASAKEQAENVMIVDLVRNDLARVSEPGSVRVPSLLAVEEYPSVWQLTSTVEAELLPDVGLVELMAALFPCGSITGAPKLRSMQIIDELEDGPRGIYCGTIGWLAPAGAGRERRGRFTIAIRTVVVDSLDGSASYGVGGGITWGSVADDEFDELQAKAAVLGSVSELDSTAGIAAAQAEAGFELLETFALVGGVARNLGRHLRRLERSALRLGFAVDRMAVELAVGELAGEREPRVVRPTAPHPGAAGNAALGTADMLADSAGTRSAGAGDQLVRIRLAADGSFHVEPRPLLATPLPVRLAIDTQPTPTTVLRAHKTSRRQVFDAARSGYPEADDVILTNEQGQVTESTVANLAVLLDGQWFTPPTSDGCLPGIGRELLLEQGKLVERSITVDALLHADAIALVGSARGWREAVLAD